jgi:ketosteroid isomerase-like protein
MSANLERAIEENLRAVEAHFHSEGAEDVERALELYTDDILWESHGDPKLGTHRGKDAVAESYRRMWACMKNAEFENLSRFATADKVVDESVLTCTIARDGLVSVPIGQRVRFNLLHVFDLRGGKISRELVYLGWTRL